MRIRLFITTILILANLLQMNSLFAFETDQYNLPPEPLADIGIEVTNYVESVVRQSVNKVNAEIQRREECLAKPIKNCDSVEKNKQRLAELHSGEVVVHEVYKVLGGGIIPFTNSGTWLEKHKFKAQPARYKPGYRESLFVFYPTSYFELASTINMFGAQFGTDKIAHLFQQGYGYYKTYQKELKKGSTENQAIEKAVKSGQKTERGIFGTLVSGVYSNGDLAANYVGLKFYLGLTKEIKIGDQIRPPVLKFMEGVWAINDSFEMLEMLLKPFVTDHLNEALNPSGFTRMFGLNAYVRHVLRSHACSEWKQNYPNNTQTDYERTTESLKRWNNEDYGWTEKKNFITIANTCFD